MNNEFSHDADMKIAPDDVSKLFPHENPESDDNIELYLRERKLGNIAAAKKLGEEYVAELLSCVWTKAPDGINAAVFDTQVKILFAYVVHRIVEDNSPNRIVANTVIGSFYEGLDREDPVIYDAVCDRANFSMYLLMHRSGKENAAEAGKLFGELCGGSECSDCRLLGESAYARFVGACAQHMADMGYRTK